MRALLRIPLIDGAPLTGLASLNDGAPKTIARCRPRLLIEIEEDRAPGAPARIHAFLRRFNYRGYFVCGCTLAAIATFDAATMQRPADIMGFRAGVPRRSFDRYCNNFLFVADEEAEPPSARIAAALQRI